MGLEKRNFALVLNETENVYRSQVRRIDPVPTKRVPGYFGPGLLGPKIIFFTGTPRPGTLRPIYNTVLFQGI